MGGLMTTIINRNDSIPVKQSEVFSTGSDFQDTVDIHVLQGERQFAKDNKSLGIFKLKGIPSAPRGVPKINVTFQLDVNGLLAVSAREEQSGQEQSIKIEGASTLGRDEVAKMIKDAEQNATLDKSKRSLVNITYELDNLITKADKFIESSLLDNRDSKKYFIENLKIVKNNYKKNNFKQIASKDLENLTKAYSYLVLDYSKYLMTESSKGTNNNPSGKGVVIDVTEE
jgi:molecular chaperone DnaK